MLVVQEHASVRKLRLVAAALVRRLQPHPENAEAKRCDDVIGAVSDGPRPWEELEAVLSARPGNWRFAHILPPLAPDRVAMELRKLVAFAPDGYTRDAIELIHEVVGNPFRPVAFDPAWRSPTAVSLAERMYESRDFAAMPVLADALQDAGCENPDVLEHCRGGGEHVRGCWVMDLVLGKS